MTTLPLLLLATTTVATETEPPNPIYLCICFSILIGAVITLFIGLHKDSVPFFLVGAIATFGAVFCCLVGVTNFARANNAYQEAATSLVEEQTEQAEQETEVQYTAGVEETLVTDLEERYQFNISDDLAEKLLGSISTEELEHGKGEGIVWRGGSETYLINSTVYDLQIAWAGDRWMLMNLFDETDPETLTELTPITQETDQ